MITFTTLLRLFISQAFAIYFLVELIPLKSPQRRNTLIAILGSTLLTMINAVLILIFGLDFYVSYYILTLTIPFGFVFFYFAVYKGAKFIFAFLSVLVINNLAVINGLFASYIFYGEYNPIVDSILRILSYIIILPIAIKFIRPIYLKMAQKLNKGWLILNLALIVSYALAYYILFVPVDIFSRPVYFIHVYISIGLTLLIYAIIFYLFIEIQLKMSFEQDKLQLSTKVESLTAESIEITSIAYKDALTGVNNRYALFKKMDDLIQLKQEFIVVFIDLDNLKKINDTYGHSKGDAYLKQFTIALQHTIEEQGDVYRLAGDEFICLIEHNIDEFNYVPLEENVGEIFSFDVPFEGMSLGLASYPNDGSNPDRLITKADQTMYKEKKEKKQLNHYK